ncbi:MAG: TIM barrel protein [Phycisphaeraceae bacterium]
MDASLAFVLETHAHTLVDTVATTLTLIDRVAAPNLKVLYQPTTFVGNEGVEASFNALLPHIGHMHLQQQGTAEGPGWIEQPGDIDYPAFFDMVKASDYRGTASLEYCWKGVAWPEVEAGGRYLLDRLRG